MTKFTLPRSGFGFSLSWANDMLWIAEDADGGEDGADGTWYGYELQGYPVVCAKACLRGEC